MHSRIMALPIQGRCPVRESKGGVVQWDVKRVKTLSLTTVNTARLGIQQGSRTAGAIVRSKRVFGCVLCPEEYPTVEQAFECATGDVDKSNEARDTTCMYDPNITCNPDCSNCPILRRR